MFEDGMDASDLVTAVEWRFNVKFQNEDLEKITTLGQLVDALTDRAAFDEGAACVTSGMFYSIRRAICQHTGISRERIKLDTEITSLLPRERRRVIWGAMAEQVDGLTPLSYPVLIQHFLLLAMAGGFVLMLFSVIAWPLLIVGLALITTFFVVCGKRPFAVEIPMHLRTIKDLVIDVATNAKKSIGRPRRKDAEIIVRGLCARLSGYPVDEIHRETDLTRDLI